jgi:SRSO17 transposase
MKSSGNVLGKEDFIMALTGKTLLDIVDGLDAYLALYREGFGRIEHMRLLTAFARGQLNTIQRKSLEPIADILGISPRNLQRFFTEYKWDHNTVRRILHQLVAKNHGTPDGVFVIDESSDAKKGDMTAGVQRQYCGESGKKDNCIVSVHLTYAADNGFRTILDGELFIPESWNPDPDDPDVTERRRRARMTDDDVHRAKTDMSITQLKRAMENGVPGSFVTADEGYGGKPGWRSSVASQGLTYVVEVPKSVCGWTREPEFVVPEYSGRGRVPSVPKPTTSPKTADAIRRCPGGLRCASRTKYRVKDTSKGAVIWDVKRCRFWESAENAPTADQSLLVLENPDTDEVKYFLTNAPESAPTETLLRVAFTRWTVERCFQDCKQKLGMNHAEHRSLIGLNRHFILTAVMYYYLQDWLDRHPEEKKTA